MKIEIIDGVYTRDEEVAALLTNSEDENLAALAQKLVIRQERQKTKALKEQEKERQKLERQKEEERKRWAALDRCFPAGNGEDTIC